MFVGAVERGKEVLKPWVSNGVSFGTFLSLLKEKYEHSRKRLTTTPQSALRLTAPLTRGAKGAARRGRIIRPSTYDNTKEDAPARVHLLS